MFPKWCELVTILGEAFFDDKKTIFNMQSSIWCFSRERWRSTAPTPTVPSFGRFNRKKGPSLVGSSIPWAYRGFWPLWANIKFKTKWYKQINLNTHFVTISTLLPQTKCGRKNHPISRCLCPTYSLPAFSAHRCFADCQLKSYLIWRRFFFFWWLDIRVYTFLYRVPLSRLTPTLLSVKLQVPTPPFPITKETT